MKKQQSIDKVIELAKSVSSNAKKMDVYRQAKREPSKEASAALSESEKKLDAMVSSMLSKEENLKDAVLSWPNLSDEVLSEVEWSYQKAVCYKRLPDGMVSRLFFLPFIYWESDDGKEDGRIDFQGPAGEALASFIGSFVAHRETQTPDAPEPRVVLFQKNLLDCLILEEEEKILPDLHQALLEGRDFSVDDLQPRGRLSHSNDEDAPGWTVGALPFALIHPDEEYLERVDFEEFAEEFMEEFEEIFDGLSKLDYEFPIVPNMIAESGARHLWQKQVQITIEEMVRIKKPKHLGVIEVTLVLADEELAGVVMDFELGDPKVPGDDQRSLAYHRQIARGALNGETGQSLGDFLLGYPELRRKDFKVIFSYDTVKPEN